MKLLRYLNYSGLAVLALLGTWALFFRGLDDSPPPAKSALPTPDDVGLTVPATSLLLGEVWEDSRFNCILPIQNASSGEINIEKFSAACDCLAANPTSLRLRPGEKRDLQLTVDLTVNNHLRANPDKFRTWVKPVVRDEGGQELRVSPWEIRAAVHKVVRFSSFELDLGKHSERAQPLPAGRVRITAVAPVTGIAASSRSKDFDLRVAQVNGNPPEYDLTVAPKGELTIGSHRFEVEVVAELDERKKVYAKPLWVRAEVANDLQASPPEVHFGAKEVGETSQASVTIRSLAGFPFRVFSFRAEGAGLELRPADESGLGATFVVRQQIARAGGQTGRLVFMAGEAQGPLRQVVVPVTYHGVCPAPAEPER